MHCLYSEQLFAVFPRNLQRCLSSLIMLNCDTVFTYCRCKAGHINIHHMPPNEVNGAWFSQQVVWLPGPSDNRLPHAVWKIPPFSGEIYEGGSVPFSSQQPLWSHSPLVDCLPNGHWQMGLKIASLAPLPQKPTVGWPACCCFPISQLLTTHLLFLSSLSRCVPSSSNYASRFPLASLLFLLFLLFTSPFVWMEVDEVCLLVHLIIASWHCSRHCVKPL